MRSNKWDNIGEMGGGILEKMGRARGKACNEEDVARKLAKGDEVMQLYRVYRTQSPATQPSPSNRYKKSSNQHNLRLYWLDSF